MTNLTMAPSISHHCCPS